MTAGGVRPALFPPDSGEELIVSLKRSVISAFRAVFDINHPNPLMRGLEVDMEYPSKLESYPSIWVSFSFTQLQKIGIYPGSRDLQDREFYQFIFSGRVTLTVLALKSWERDAIASEILQVFAFSRVTENGRRFREVLYDNPYINFNFNEDTISPLGQGMGQGLEWAKDIFEYTDGYSFDLIGQFRSAPDTESPLIDISEIRTTPYIVKTLETTSEIVDDGNGAWI